MAVINTIGALKSWSNIGEALFGNDLNGNFSEIKTKFDAHTHTWAAGSAAQPSIRFEASDTTGIYLSGSNDSVGIVSLGTRRLEVHPTGVTVQGTLTMSGTSAITLAQGGVASTNGNFSTTTGNGSFGGTLTVGGATSLQELTATTATLSSTLIGTTASEWVIRRNDQNALITIAGGNSSNDGGVIQLIGSTHASLASRIRFLEGNTLRGTMTGGILAWGGTNVTNAAAGDIVIKKQGGLRFGNQAGTSTLLAMTQDDIGAGDGVFVGTDQALLYIRSNDFGATSLRVTLGAADSAGAGFRTVRVPN